MCVMRWVDPHGYPHEVADAKFRKFCADRGLHYDNLIEHTKKLTSDQKCNGWRLIDRLRHIGPVGQPDVIVPAIGTIEYFWQACCAATDGRQCLKDRSNFVKLMGGDVQSAGKYNKGQPYCGWERRQLSAERGMAFTSSSLGTPAAGAPGPLPHCFNTPLRPLPCA